LISGFPSIIYQTQLELAEQIVNVKKEMHVPHTETLQNAENPISNLEGQENSRLRPIFPDMEDRDFPQGGFEKPKS
jgi:hypothetical protein